MTAERSCYRAVMTIFQQTSFDRFTWFAFAFLSIYLNNGTLSSTKVDELHE